MLLKLSKLYKYNINSYNKGGCTYRSVQSNNLFHLVEYKLLQILFSREMLILYLYFLSFRHQVIISYLNKERINMFLMHVQGNINNKTTQEIDRTTLYNLSLESIFGGVVFYLNADYGVREITL